MAADVTAAALPPGFTLDDQPPPQQPIAAPGGTAALPPGFTLNAPVEANRQADVATGNLATDIPRFLGTAAANIAAGATSLPRTLAKGVDMAAGVVGLHPGADAALASIPSPGHPGYSLFPDYQTARNVFLSGTGATEYVPQTWLGRRAMDATTGAMAGVLGGPAAVLPSALGSATAGQAAETFPNHPLLAAMLGFSPGASAGKMLFNTPQRIASLATDSNMTEPYGAFVRQGLPTDLSGTATGTPWLLNAEKVAGRMPGSESTLANARGNLVDAWQSRLNTIASRLGTAATPQEVGTSLQSAAQDWLSNFKTNTGQLWNDFYSKVPGGTQIGLTNYQGALKNVLGNFAGAPETGDVLQPQTVKRLSDALGVDLQSSGGTLPWDAVKNIRSAIGEKLENPQTVSDTSQAALKQLYAGLTRDMEAGAGGVSSDALTAFHKANAATAAGHDLLETQLDPILRATNPENAATYAMGQARQGGSRLGAITFNLPSAAGDLSSYALRNAASANESPSALASSLLGRKPIYSPEAMNVLFPDAATRADVNDLATVGKAMGPAEKDLANSPTATHQMRNTGRIFTALELSKEGHELAGTPGRIAGAALGAFAPNVLGRGSQVAALNPYVAALYGHEIPMSAQSPSLLGRALIGPAVMPQIPAPGFALGAPATSANLPQISQ